MNENMVLFIVGAVMPPAIDLVNKYVPNSIARFVITLLLTGLAGGVLSIAMYGGEAVFADMTLVFTASQIVYNIVYKKSALQERIR